MAKQLVPEDPADVAAALVRWREHGGAAGHATDRADLKLLTKHYLAVLQHRAPGNSVEVRVLPFAAVQVIPGVRHTRGTPPAVVELSAAVWIGLAVGEVKWADAEHDGRLRASGERADLTSYLPLT
ncbi:MAG: sterol carrier family protein [Nocardioides sp.]|nr:sterol carrier family protein [Nocardioides sp.]